MSIKVSLVPCLPSLHQQCQAPRGASISTSILDLSLLKEREEAVSLSEAFFASDRACRGSLAQDGLAQDFNICTFPYYGCNPTFNNSCITVSVPEVDGQVYSFNLTSSCPAPLNTACSQTLYKIEFNTCRCSRTG
jgi:hypothetical protein